MRNVVFKARIKRDMKKMKRRGKDLEKLTAIARILSSGAQLPARAQIHKLSGEYEGRWECHIEPDWLLIFDISDDAVILFRTGSHADLFE